MRRGREEGERGGGERRGSEEGERGGGERRGREEGERGGGERRGREEKGKEGGGMSIQEDHDISITHSPVHIHTCTHTSQLQVTTRTTHQPPL